MTGIGISSALVISSDRQLLAQGGTAMIFTSPFSRFLDDFGQILEETPWRWADRHSMAVNVWSNDEQVVVQVELPGIDPEQVELSVLRDRLLVKAERNVAVPEGASVHQSERSDCSLERNVSLPFEVDAATASAEYKNGILHVVIKRVQADKPKQVKIKIK
jgi:HSP20 family protein